MTKKGRWLRNIYACLIILSMTLDKFDDHYWIVFADDPLARV